ncbi:MAG: alpha-L-fucosidase, partial [Acidobacteria bacterium]|nr:alpha-L-fucosidase [Acidobacteriota bacterium]
MPEPSRREFLAQTAALAGSMLAARSLPLLGEMAENRQSTNAMRLWYSKPASQWVEALPIGNGRLGAMVFGGIERERLQLNEDTLWSGGPKDWNNPKAPAALAEVRRLIAAERYVEADAAAKGMQGPFTQSYMPMGNLYLAFEHGDSARGGYRRELDIAQALTEIRYTVGGTSYTREIFASRPDQVVIVRLAADKPGMISFTATMDSQLRHTLVANGDILELHGRAPSNVDPSYHDREIPVQYDDGEGMTFETHLAAAATGGRTWVEGGELHVRGADAVVLRLTAATSFNGPSRSPAHEGKAPGPIAAAQLRSASAKSFAALRDAHVADHRALFDRVALEIDQPPAAKDLPTDERIVAFGAKDSALVSLFFQYGRYLLIASSRPGGQPANLQGIWNDQVRPPWSSNFTININTEMNYWPAETTNLAELHEPLMDFIEHLAVNGRETARINYGARGWVAHHNSDVWAQTAPVGDYGGGDPVWANWHGASAWL